MKKSTKKVKEPTLTLMVGYPRCGKTTWLKKYKQRGIVVCLDAIRKEIFGHQFHLPAEPFILGVAKGIVRLSLQQGLNVTVDATNLLYQYREEWRRLASGCGAKTKIVWIDTPLNVCLLRNRRSPKGEKLPVKVLKAMAARFEEPNRIFEKPIRRIIYED